MGGCALYVLWEYCRKVEEACVGGDDSVAVQYCDNNWGCLNAAVDIQCLY